MWRWVTEKREEFQRVKETGSKYRATITPDEVGFIVSRMVFESIAGLEALRDFGFLTDDRHHEQYLQRLADKEEENRAALSRGIIEEGLQRLVETRLKGHGYSIPADSLAFKQVCIQYATGRAAAIEAKRAMLEGKPINTPPKPEPPQPKNEEANRVPLLSEVIASFIEGLINPGESMLRKYDVTLRLFREVLGNKPVDTIRQVDIEGFFRLLCKLPPRWSDEERKRGVGVKELAAMEWKKVLHKKTFDSSYMAAFVPFLRVSQRLFGDQGFPRHLTAKDIPYSGNRTETEDNQRAMKPHELKRLFEGVEAQGFARNRGGEHCYWLPLIGLYTGARVNEVCQLNPQCDFIEEDGILCFHFTDETEGDSRIEKSSKTRGSRRVVPIHSKLLELGILDYIKRMKDGGHALLFPQFPPSKGRASGKAEKWFRAHIKKLGLRDETLGAKLTGFHTFRYTFVARADDVEAGIYEWITGHVEPHRTAVVRRYRGKVSAARKQEVLEKVTFDLAFPVPRH